MRDADDFASEGFGVGVSARAGAGQADIHCVDAQRFHQVQDFDFFARCWDRGRRDFAGRRAEFRRSARRGGGRDFAPVAVFQS